MITHRKKFYGGVLLLAGFSAVLIAVFLPLFNGANGLSYLDSLYNSISKGSAYYIPELKAEAAKFSGQQIALTLTLDDERRAAETAALFQKSGARVEVDGNILQTGGDLAAILDNALADADAMFANDGRKIVAKYGYDERQALYNWYLALKGADRELKKQKRFAEAKFVAAVLQKGVECAYNYYGIAPKKIAEGYGLVLFSLLFYVVYTVWYGFAVLNLFEGLGFGLEH